MALEEEYKALEKKYKESEEKYVELEKESEKQYKELFSIAKGLFELGTTVYGHTLDLIGYTIEIRKESIDAPCYRLESLIDLVYSEASDILDKIARLSKKYETNLDKMAVLIDEEQF